MAHSHEHQHDYAGGNDYGRAFALGIGLNIAFVAVEIIYGLISNSSALLADAGHNASDVLGLVFAWTATRLATIKPKGKYTYGLRKTTILVSILNALLLFGAVVAIGWDAIEKLYNPEPVAGTPVIIVAAIGVAINSLTALLFIKGQKNDLNIKGAFLHMAADAGVSLGVVVAGLLINITGLQWIDPLTSFLIIAVILWGTWSLFTDSIDLALDAVPKHIDIDKVKDFLISQKEVLSIHDLHIWAMSTTNVALSVHIITSVQTDGSFIQEIQHALHEKFSIGHTTIQIEYGTVLKDCDTNCN